VGHPDQIRSRLASFLGLQPQETSTVSEAHQLFAPWETWKERALEPITRDRVDGVGFRAYVLGSGKRYQQM
jgi:hypothetical protein